MVLDDSSALHSLLTPCCAAQFLKVCTSISPRPEVGDP